MQMLLMLLYFLLLLIGIYSLRWRDLIPVGSLHIVILVLMADVPMCNIAESGFKMFPHEVQETALQAHWREEVHFLDKQTSDACCSKQDKSAQFFCSWWTNPVFLSLIFNLFVSHTSVSQSVKLLFRSSFEKCRRMLSCSNIFKGKSWKNFKSSL